MLYRNLCYYEFSILVCSVRVNNNKDRPKGSSLPDLFSVVFFSFSSWFSSKKSKQECIPVGCVPSARQSYPVVFDGGGFCPTPNPPVIILNTISKRQDGSDLFRILHTKSFSKFTEASMYTSQHVYHVVQHPPF